MKLPRSPHQSTKADAALVRTGFMALGLWTSACGVLFDYPEGEAEMGTARCSDGEDNDYDGQVDCDDWGCMGSCPEESPAECGDRRDNDGDGLTDSDDPRCWLNMAPQASRCSEGAGADVTETFDTEDWDSPSASWQRNGNSPDGTAPIVASVFRSSTLPASASSAETRQDRAVSFWYDTDGSETLGDNLGSLWRQQPFAGSWQSFELSFSALVPAQTLLRAAVVPIELAPSFDPPLPGADTALLSVTLDRSRSPPVLTVSVEGVRTSKLLPESSCKAASCTSLDRVTVTLGTQGFRARVSDPDGVITELGASVPKSPSLPASRLAFWGASTTLEQRALLDDVHLHVTPEWPCGFAVPQIPGEACEFADAFASFGQSVSVARSAQGRYCALVTASADAAGAPQTLSAWQSSDGERWSPASSPEAPPFALPEGAALVGAGIAADGAGWHAAVAYRRGSAVELGFADAESCDRWGTLGAASTLFEDAEAPSYVIANGRHDVFFTRARNRQAPRRLFRISRREPAQPEPLAELGPDVGQPVNVQRVGSSDLVLAYPAAGSSSSGVGLLVSGSDLHVWKRVDPSPVLKLSPRLSEYEGRLAFDDRGVVSAAISFDAGGGFLMYGAASTTRGAGSGFEPVVAVGTARLRTAAHELSTNPSLPPDLCGDGTCGPGEACASCPSDCPCSGVELLADAFTDKRPWRVVSSDPNPAEIQYVGTDPPGLNWTGGAPTWSVLALERALSGDFELSFDVRLGLFEGSLLPCAAYVGLGRTDPDVDAPHRKALVQTGVFARFGLSAYCDREHLALPQVLVDGALVSALEKPAPAAGCRQYLDADATRHVVLRRRRSQVSVLVPRSDGCGTLEQSVTYPGALGSLSELIVGFGGGAFDGCQSGAGAGTVSNLKLRLLDDPAHCPAGTTLCGADSERPSCVDMSTSSEHCGACGHGCAANELCKNGTCVCADLPGIVECGGACVDSQRSIDHCGACDRPCSERCVRGVCDPIVGDCLSPREVPAEGGTVELDLSPSGAPFSILCDTYVTKLLVLNWTPTRDGTALFTLDVAGAFGVTETAGNSNCTATECQSVFDPAEGGTTPKEVKAGRTYRIVVGPFEPLREHRLGTLRIEMQ